MSTEPADQPRTPADPASAQDARRRLWRRIFWVALLLPLLPAALIGLVALVAGMGGCMAAPMDSCRPLGPLLRLLVPWAEWTGAIMAYGVVLAVGLCCLALHILSERMAVRLLGGLAAALLLGIVPILGPSLAMGGLVHPGCSPNEGGVGDCVLFGVSIGPSAHALATLPWLLLVAPLLALLTFAAYALVALVGRAARRPAGTA